jgi:Mg-chelatase subunit ChlD
MSRVYKLLCGAAFLAAVAFPGPATAQENKQKPAAAPRPEVEVVFCLDTTGSMSGLIDAAKRKIWSICSQIATGKPTPRLKVGLVAYRDRGDAYVTKIFDLTEDLDAVYSNLMGFQAAGGGDFPESVNQALHESVTKIKWGKGKKTLKIIFLVGDAPPHMNYANDVKYPETCKLAAGRDIIINTIQCGTHAETKKYWQEICRLAEGAYVQIDEKGGPVVTIATPFDGDLAKINTELNRKTLVYGSRAMQSAGEGKKALNAALAPGVAADRAAYYGFRAAGGPAPIPPTGMMGGAYGMMGGRPAGGMGMMGGGFGGLGAAPSYDLLESIKAKTVKLEQLKKEELPPELQKLTLKAQKVYLEKLDKERGELTKKAADLAQKRSKFIAQKQAEQMKHAARDSFDNQVLRVLQRQARRVDVRYDAPAVEEKKKK